MNNQTQDNRRTFIKKFTAITGLTPLAGMMNTVAWQALLARESSAESMELLKIIPPPQHTPFKPMDEITVKTDLAGIISVWDGAGREYLRESITQSVTFQIAGALGNHIILFANHDNQLIGYGHFRVDCQTEINDMGQKFSQFLKMLYWTMVQNGEAQIVYYNNKFYHFFVRWLRDHVHTLKGMKYFYSHLQSGIDLYADSQCEDGMIWDNFYPRTPEKNDWDRRFASTGFIKPVANDTYEFKRIPVENDVEYLFIEGVYYTWKATGDDAWMTSKLEAALKAIKYSTTHPYRWSEKYQLLKRGFTIDTWDFQSKIDEIFSNDDPMLIGDKTRFGIMFGDNTGMAMSCRYLAEMLTYVGNHQEAERIDKIGKDIKERLDAVSWNGTFYTHHVPEDSNIKRDLGVDQSQQIALSNAYSLNRGLTHEQATAIITSYQKIRQQMPKSSPGEWYTIYPPFRTGFDKHNPVWEYMNGGVTPIVAGELAHGAFEHGFEAYGVDILERLIKLAQQTNNFLKCCYRGAMPEPPSRQFVPLNLKPIANVDLAGQGAEGVPGWSGQGENDLHEMPTGFQTFHDIPFNIIAPETNGRRACLGLSQADGYVHQAHLTINQTASAIYFLHVMGSGTLAGTITLIYQDNTSFIDYISTVRKNANIGNWWYPKEPERGKRLPTCKVAWRGANKFCPNVGVFLYGLDNPYPEKIITAIKFESVKKDTKWFVLGVTLADKPVFLMPGITSYGIPDSWGAAAVVYALIEGLVGIKDTGVAFNKVLLTPRWTTTDVTDVSATAKYEASGGYLSYRYQFDSQTRTLQMTLTSNSTDIQVEILLPANEQISWIKLNDEEPVYHLKQIEKSTYVCFPVKGLGVHKITMNLIEK
jgi:hypothetical protein